MQGFTSSRRRNRRSARSLLAEESAAEERSGRPARVKRRATGVPDASLIQKEAAGDVAAGRQLRNRNSARRSRDKRLHQEHAFAHAACVLEELLAEEVSGLAVPGLNALASAEQRARSGFVKLEPQRRAVGSRTDTRDEELQRKAREGDEDARRVLKNRESARMSRQRRIDAWNIACMRLLVAAAKAETGLAPRACSVATSGELSDTIAEARRCQAEFGAKAAVAAPASSRKPTGPSATSAVAAGSPARSRAWTDATSVDTSSVGRLSASRRSVDGEAASSGGRSPVSRPSSALSQRSRRSDSELSGCDMPLPLPFGSSADFARALGQSQAGVSSSSSSSSRGRALSSHSHYPSYSQQSIGGMTLPVAATGGLFGSIAGNLSRTVHALA